MIFGEGLVEENKAEISFNPALLRIERRKIPLRAKKDNEFTATEDLVIESYGLQGEKLVRFTRFLR